MACGLGAVVLFFLIVKHNVDRGSVEADTLLTELESMQQQKQQLEKDITATTRHHADELKLDTELQKKLLDLQKTIASLGEQTAARKSKNQQLKSDIVNTEVKTAADVVADPSVGEEQYLLGLKVEGKQIAILIDHSASMTDEKLVDVVSRKIRSDADKRKGPKWRRTKKTVRWLLNRLPPQSQVAVLGFNDKARVLGAGAWHNSKDPAAIKQLFTELEQLVPTGATNLQAGLNELQKLQPAATDIYLITDGLPTQSVSKPSRLSKCGSLFGRSNNISGACREKLFLQALKDSAPTGAKVNIILLPLEGDPAAAPNFWRWASVTGGLMMTPAKGWP